MNVQYVDPDEYKQISDDNINNNIITTPNHNISTASYSHFDNTSKYFKLQILLVLLLFLFESTFRNEINDMDKNVKYILLYLIICIIIYILAKDDIKYYINKIRNNN